MIGERTRAALEREKMLALRSIKELEFDRAMGKLSDEDWQEMSGAAARARRPADAAARRRRRVSRADRARSREAARRRTDERLDQWSGERTPVCAQCATANDTGRAVLQGVRAGARDPLINTMDTKDTKGKLVRSQLCVLILCVLGVLCVEPAQLRAQFQMPDAKEMSGIPRPVDDLPNGTISVRLIRGELSNNIAESSRRAARRTKVLTVKTDENGRAQFDELTAGATVKASADVDGEHLESQEFPAPAEGGIRLMLVATDTAKPAAAPNAPAIKGEVVLGSESRIVIEPGDEAVAVFYLLDIVEQRDACR